MAFPHSQRNHSISSHTAWKSLENIVDRFKFDEEESLRLMGDMPRSTYYKGLKTRDSKLNRDQLERISYLLGIYKGLRILFTDSAQAMSWINRPNALPPFNGKTPREFMMQGSIVRLAEVRQFIDYWRG
jgi:uncharacterized protein (DUF2384 family)